MMSLDYPPRPGGIATGTHAGYQWLTSDRHCIGDIVRLCPEAIIGRYLAVTSTDSGDPHWWAEKLSGWECRGFTGYSPRVERLDGILYQIDGPEAPGFDEWWTFDSAHDLGEVIQGNPWTEEALARPGRFLTFVNYFYLPEASHETEDLLLWKEFWNQIVKHQPESYISDGREAVTFVSRNPQLFEKVRTLFEARSKIAGI
jgi:hypothetical protein